MDENAKKARAAYYREWRKRHPEKTKQYLEKYWMKKAMKLIKSKSEDNQIQNTD